MRPPSSESFSGILRRFIWLVLVFYAAISLALWAVHLAFPGAIGGVSDYTISVSLTIAATFGALYLASILLQPRSQRDAAQDEA